MGLQDFKHHAAALHLQEDWLPGRGGQQALVSEDITARQHQGAAWTVQLSTLPQCLPPLDPADRPRPSTEGAHRGRAQHHGPGGSYRGTAASGTSSPRTNYFLYLTEWEKKDEDRLLQQLKLAILNIQQEITDRDDFNHFITEALKDVANKNQPLPYFVRETWPKNNILEINSRNVSGANPPYRLDLLPATKYPDKFFREEFSSADTARNYALVEYLNDPPYHDMTTYTYEAGVTQIMTQKDFCRFLGLTYLRLRLAEDHAAGRLRSTAKRSAADMDTSM